MRQDDEEVAKGIVRLIFDGRGHKESAVSRPVALKEIKDALQSKEKSVAEECAEIAEKFTKRFIDKSECFGVNPIIVMNIREAHRKQIAEAIRKRFLGEG